jgi:hypothetical protein
MNAFRFWSRVVKFLFVDWFTFYDSPGASAPANTSSTVTQNTIPGWARPYAQSMMRAGMDQVFERDDKGRIIGMQKYEPFTAQSQDKYNDAIAQASKGVAGFTPLQDQAFKAASSLQLPGQFAEGSDLVRQSAMGSLGIAQMAPQLGQTALGYGSQAAGYGSQAAGYGSEAAALGKDIYPRTIAIGDKAIELADMYGAQGAKYGMSAADMARLGYESQRAYEQKATSPYAVQQFMSPYIQASLDPQLKLLAQQTGIQGAAQQAAATSSGAFGGSRSALQNALTQQAGNIAAQQAIGQGYQQAYDKAIQSMQYGAGLGIQGLQAGTQAQLAGVQGAQAGLQGVGQRLGGGQLQVQGALAGIEGQKAGIQGAGMGIQGAQAGIQGVNAATQANQLGLAGYGQVGAQGVNLANIGNLQLGAQQGIIGLQSQMGGMQQQQQQNIINQAMQDYNTAQEYPYQQLGFLNSLIRGIPQQQTQLQYRAAPNPWSQVAGTMAGVAAPALASALSDERTKENIVKVGELINGIGLYEFEYKPEFKDEYGAGRYRGVMAQDVERIMPEAIVAMPGGYMGVNYDMVGTWMEAL